MAGEEFLIIGMVGLPFLVVGMLLNKFVIDPYGRVKIKNSMLKRNRAVAEMHTAAGRVFAKEVDLDEKDFEWRKSTYKVDPSKVFLHDKCPVVQYKENDAVAIDPRTGPTNENPTILQQQKRTIFSLLAASLINDEARAIKMILLISAASAGIALITLVFVNGLGGPVNSCITEIHSLNQSIYGALVG